MKRAEIMETIRGLAKSQGFYGRLQRQLEEMQEKWPEAYDRYMKELEKQCFVDALDLVIYLES